MATYLTTRYPLATWAPIPLRVILGIGFLFHGAPKVFVADQHTQFVGMLQGIGVPAPEPVAWGVGLVETAGGICLILGALVTLFSTLLLIDMLVAMFAVHLASGFSFINIVGQTEQGPIFGMPGYEVNLLYVAALLALILGGPGALALENRLRRGTTTVRKVRVESAPAAPARPRRTPEVPVGSGRE